MKILNRTIANGFGHIFLAILLAVEIGFMWFAFDVSFPGRITALICGGLLIVVAVYAIFDTLDDE